MRILLSNDDGIYAPGIRALAEHFFKKHEIIITAPDSERSGAGHSFTYKSPLRARRAILPGLEQLEAYAVSGTPADCVKLAYGNLAGKVDLVISGINLGSNLGTDCFYSGTVAAAMEGAFQGMQAIAVSNVSADPKDYGACLAATEYAMELLIQNKNLRMLNVNAPDCSRGELKGFKLTAMSCQQYVPEYEKRQDPFGGAYYWVSPNRISGYFADRDDDNRWTAQGYAALTPLLADMTDYTMLKKLTGSKGE